MKANKKVLFCYETNCGGETIEIDNLYNQLKSTNPKSYKALKFHKLESLEKIKFITWIIKSFLFWIVKILQSNDFEYVATSSYTAGVVASLSKHFFKIKLIYLYHGSRLLYENASKRTLSKLTPKIQKSMVYFLHKIFINKADMITVPSRSAMNSFVSEFPFADKKKVFILPNGINTKKFNPVSKKLLSKYKNSFTTNKNDKIILSVGRIDKNKNTGKLLEIFSNLRQKNKNVKLIVANFSGNTVSEKNYEIFIRKKITKLKIQDSVFIQTDVDDVERFYWISDLVISLSTKETFSLVMLEAFASKTLFMSTDVGAVNKLMNKFNNKMIINKNWSTNKITNQIQNILNLPLAEKNFLVRKQYLLSQKYDICETAKKFQTLVK